MRRMIHLKEMNIIFMSMYIRCQSYPRKLSDVIYTSIKRPAQIYSSLHGLKGA